MVQQFFDWAFKSIITGCIVYGVGVMSKLQASVENLNVNVAVVIERVANHEKEIERLERTKMDKENK